MASSEDFFADYVVELGKGKISLDEAKILDERRKSEGRAWAEATVAAEPSERRDCEVSYQAFCWAMRQVEERLNG